MSAPKLVNGLTLKRERFSQEVVNNGGNATKAYRASYDTNTDNDATVWNNASQLMRVTEVAARILELAEAQGLAAGISQRSVLAQLIDHSRNAAADGQYGPAVRATELQGKAIGMFREQVDVSGGLTLVPGGAASKLSVEELRALLGEPDDGAPQLEGAGDGNRNEG